MHRSTETAFIKLTCHQTYFCTGPVSAAFDTTGHHILMQSLTLTLGHVLGHPHKTHFKGFLVSDLTMHLLMPDGTIVKTLQLIQNAAALTDQISPVKLKIDFI